MEKEIYEKLFSLSTCFVFSAENFKYLIQIYDHFPWQSIGKDNGKSNPKWEVGYIADFSQPLFGGERGKNLVVADFFIVFFYVVKGGKSFKMQE